MGVCSVILGPGKVLTECRWMKIIIAIGALNCNCSVDVPPSLTESRRIVPTIAVGTPHPN
jgi:hypothetical protein